jgi:hypothetical protein
MMPSRAKPSSARSASDDCGVKNSFIYLVFISCGLLHLLLLFEQNFSEEESIQRGTDHWDIARGGGREPDKGGVSGA